jgi:hypothetical protein
VDDSQAQGGAGSSYYPLNFTNGSGSACEMYGFPGVSFAASATAAGYVSHTFSACTSASAVLLTVLPVRAGQGVAGVTP